MREIKFRGKRLDDTIHNGDWVYGYYVFYPEENKAIIETYSCEDVVDPKTVGQFIGLHDVEGKEIYEGDICDVIDPYDDFDLDCVVKYDSQASGYLYEPYGGFEDYDTTTIGWAMQIGWKFKVIGNIHDNPELVEEEVGK